MVRIARIIRGLTGDQGFFLVEGRARDSNLRKIRDPRSFRSESRMNSENPIRQSLHGSVEAPNLSRSPALFRSPPEKNTRNLGKNKHLNGANRLTMPLAPQPAPSSRKDPAANLGFEAKLWLAADKLRNNMDAANSSGAKKTAEGSPQGERGGANQYKHVVLGLIFLKYISDSFEEHRTRLIAGKGEYASANPEDPDEPSGARQPAAGSPKGQRGGAEQYRAENIFWVPKEARWPQLQANAKQPTIGKLVDYAMVAIERDNPRLKGVLPKDYARPALDTAWRDCAFPNSEAIPQSLSAAKDKHRLGELIDFIGTIGLGDRENRAKDIVGRVYEYFLSQFASAEGKKGGQFYTPTCIVRLLVEMLAPCKGRVYDPCCGSGGSLPAFRRLRKMRFAVKDGAAGPGGVQSERVCRSARWPLGRHHHLWPGEQRHHERSGAHESGHSRHRNRLVLANPHFQRPSRPALLQHADPRLPLLPREKRRRLYQPRLPRPPQASPIHRRAQTRHPHQNLLLPHVFRFKLLFLR